MGRPRRLPGPHGTALRRLHHLSGAGDLLQQPAHAPDGPRHPVRVRRPRALPRDPHERRRLLEGRAELAGVGRRRADRRHPAGARPRPRAPRARALRALLPHRVVHARADVLPGRRRDLVMGLQLRLGHRQPHPARRRSRRFRPGVAGVAGHRPARAHPGHDVDVRRLQHGRPARRHPRHSPRVPGGGDGRRGRRLAPAAPHHRALAATDDRQPGHPGLHRQDEAVRARVGHDAGRPDVGHRNGGDLRGQAGVRVEDARPRLSVRHRRDLVRDHLRAVAAADPRPAAARGPGVLTVRRRLGRLILMVPVLVYTVFSAGPYLWTATMSLRTTDEIYRSHYGLPIPAHWDKYARAWNEFGYATYFKNSTIVSVASVLLVTVIGAMAGFAFARRRYRFPLREPLFLLIFLSVMFPPQIMLLALFQILVQYRLFNSLIGLVLVYTVTELPLTIYLLRAFFAQIPTELEEAARIDGCSDWATFWRVMFPMALPAVATTVILNFIYFWNEFLYAVVFITQQKIRTLPLAIQFLVSDQYQDVGMLATGLMIATLPVLVLYLFLSEWFVKGMTAGAVKG